MAVAVAGLKIVPVTQADAKRFIARHHRHSGAPLGAICCVAVESHGEIVGVGVLGHPIARKLQDGFTAEITRVCTTGERNACSMIYGALRRAAVALGYTRVITYTLADEDGASLKASGFREAATVPAHNGWHGKPSGQYATDLFGQHLAPRGAKTRWEWAA